MEARIKLQMRRYSAFFCGLLVASLNLNFAKAAVNAWSTIGPDGGTILKVAYSPSNPSIVYAAAMSGFYRSVDGGSQWQLVKNDFYNTPRDIAVDPTNSARVFVVTPDGVFSSLDSGATLLRLATFPSINEGTTQIEFSADGSVLYVSASNRIFRSLDTGHTWEERTAIVGSTSYCISLVADTANPNIVHALFGDNVAFRSTNGASSWTAMPLPSAVAVHELALTPSGTSRIWAATSNGVFVSSDAGAHWSATPLTIPVADLAIHPTLPTTLYAGSQVDGIYKSVDDGLHWVNVNGSARAGQIITVAISPSAPANLMMGGYSSLWASTNAGVSWAQRDHGIYAHSIVGLSVAGASDSIYASAGSGGIFKRQGGASSMSPLNNEALLQATLSPYALGTSAVLAQSGTQDRVFAATSAGVARSTTGGASWQLLSLQAFGNNQVVALADSFADPQKILAGTYNGFYRTIDGGDHWAPATGLPADPSTYLFATTPANPNVVYAAPYTIGIGAPVGNGIYKSVDFGLHWTPANVGIESIVATGLAVDPTDEQIIYAATADGPIKSTNAGASWTTLNWSGAPSVASANVVAIDSAHPQIIYAGRVGRIARSVDAGSSWEELLTPQTLPIRTPKFMLTDPQRPENLLVATFDHGIQEITVAPNLTLEGTGPADILALGATVNYQYTVRNIGPFHATGVRLVVPLPAGVTNISATPSAGACTVASTVVTCIQPVLRLGLSAQVSIAATFGNAGQFDVVGTLTGDQPDIVTTNNVTHTLTTVAELADLSITAAGPSSIPQGNAINYSLVVANAGPNTSSSVNVQYQLASGLTPGVIGTTRGACTVNGSGLVTCAIGSLAAQASATISVAVALPALGAYHNIATVTANGVDTVQANNAATVDTNVVASSPSVSTTVSTPAINTSGGGGGIGFAFAMVLLLLGIARPAQLFLRHF